MDRHRPLAAIAIVLATLPASAAEPPRPDLNGVERQLAAKIEALERDVAEKPDSPQAWGLLAMNLDIHDFKSAAIGYYERAARLDPDDFRWPYYRAMCLVELGLPGAVEDFAAALALEPTYAPLLVRYGETLMGTGDLESASKRFSSAIGADPPIAAHAYLGLARIALARGDLELSLYRAQRAVKQAPRHGTVHGLLAELHRRNGDRAQARQEMSLAQRFPGPAGLPDAIGDALVAEGASSYWYLQRGRAYLGGRDYERAAGELRKAVDAAPKAEHHDLFGLSLFYLGRHEEALEQHRAALELQPDFPAARLHLGADLFETGDVDAAIEATEQALEAQPDLPGGELNLGRFYDEAGRQGQAIEVFKRALKRTPDDPRLIKRLAWLLATSPDAALRDGEEARRLAEHACQATRFRDPQALDVLAAAYAEAGQFDQAVKTAGRARAIAQRARQGELTRQIEGRLSLYEAGEPYREKRP